jgi:RNA polymerase sigma-70 factor (ECF subfamily)
VTTQTLVARARHGDVAAYEMLFTRFHDEIHRFAARRLSDAVAGQDVAAEPFTDAFTSLSRFRWRGVPFEAWLYTIARRRVADHLRARVRTERAGAAEPDPRPAVDPGTDVVQTMHVRALVARLPDSQRDVIELRFMEDLDVAQTAMRLGKTPGAVRVAQHRALARLRTMLEGVTT